MPIYSKNFYALVLSCLKMPKRFQGKPKNVRLPNTSTSRNRNLSEGEVFRNFFAVGDDVDPHQSLRSMQEMFNGKIDHDVVAMIFSECAYNVDQAFETLISIANDVGHCGEDLVLPLVSSESNGDNNCQVEDKVNCPISGTTNSEKPFLANSHIDTILPISDSETSHVVQNVESCADNKMDRKSYSGNSNFAASRSDDVIIGIDSKSTSKPVVQGIIAIDEHQSHAMAVQFQNNSSIPWEAKTQNFVYPSIKENRFPFILNKNPHNYSTSPYFMENLMSPQSKNTYFNQNVSPSLRNSVDFITPLFPVNAHRSIPTAYFSSVPSKDKNVAFSNNKNLKNVKVDDYANKIDEIISNVMSDDKVMVIMRGLPGSGKSTLARQLKFSGVIFSTDDYFSRSGKYNFDYTKLSEAHDWNRLRTDSALKNGKTPIIIDNTNVEAWEMVPYVKLGLKFNYKMYLLEPNNTWKFKPGKLARKNTHKVTKDKLERMLERYDHNIAIESIIESLKNTSDIDEESTKQLPEAQMGENTKNRESIGKMDKIDSFSDDSLTGDSMCGQPTTISLEAVVHRADEINLNINSEVEISIDNLNSVSPAKDIKIGSEQNFDEASDIDELGDNDEVRLDNLNTLKILLREDSEESQSLSHSQPIPSTDSSQDISGWEAITEHDDDFLWSSKPVDDAKMLSNSVISESSGSVNSSTDSNLPGGGNVDEKLATGSNSNSFCSEDPESPTKCHSYGSEAQQRNFHSGEKYTELSTSLADEKESNALVSKPSLKSNTLNPKPQRHFSTVLHLEEESVSDCVNELNYNGNMPGNSLFVWASLNDKITKDWNDDSETTKLNGAVMLSEPKPQRKLLGNFSNSEEHEIAAAEFKNKIPNNCDMATNTPVKSSRVRIAAGLSFPLSTAGSFTKDGNWSFPKPPKDDLQVFLPPVKYGTETTVSSTQTEPSDFVVLNKIENNPLYIPSVKVLMASYKECDVEISETVKENNFPDEKTVPSVAGHDRSTSTDDTIDDLETYEKIGLLQSNFPEISEVDLKHLIELCHGDITWISNILREWGYKYNVPLNEDILSSNKVEEAESMEIGQLDSSKSDIVFKEPVPKPEMRNGELFSHLQSAESEVSVPNAVSMEVGAKVTEQQPIESKMQAITLTLDPSFALKLEELFGPVVQHKSQSFETESLHINIDYSLAKILYDKWKETYDSWNSASKQDRGTEYSDISSKTTENKPQQSHVVYGSSSSSCEKSGSSSKPAGELTFSEIMDMEYALQLHQKEQTKKSRANEDYATKLRRKSLYQMFPGVDTAAVDDVFESTNFSVENTVLALEEMTGRPAEVREFVCENSADANLLENSNTSFEGETWTNWVDQGALHNIDNIEELENATVTPEAENLRAEATMYYHMRQQCLKQRQSAAERGMREVSSYYSQKADYHGRQCKEANKKAAQLILSFRNEHLGPLVLDLHGLYVQEAIPALMRFLRRKTIELCSEAPENFCTVTVVTGKGAHSMRIPKLRPSVINFLRSNGYRFDEENIGVFSVQLPAVQS